MLFIIPDKNSYVSICDSEVISIFDSYIKCKVNFTHADTFKEFRQKILDKIGIPSNFTRYYIVNCDNEVSITFYNTYSSKTIKSLKCSAEFIASFELLEKNATKLCSTFANYYNITGASTTSANLGYYSSYTGATTARMRVRY